MIRPSKTTECARCTCRFNLLKLIDYTLKVKIDCTLPRSPLTAGALVHCTTCTTDCYVWFMGYNHCATNFNFFSLRRNFSCFL